MDRIRDLQIVAGMISTRKGGTTCVVYRLPDPHPRCDETLSWCDESRPGVQPVGRGEGGISALGTSSIQLELRRWTSCRGVVEGVACLACLHMAWHANRVVVV